MIDMKVEKTYILSQAVKFVDSLRPGKPTHPATLARWIMVGSRGIKLDGLRIGGKWVTSREALQRFADQQTALALGQTSASTPSALSKNAEKADRQLAALGL